MKDSSVTQDRRQKKRRRERVLILIAIFVIIGLTFLETRLLHISPSVSLGGNILLFVFINVNLILLLSLIFLVLRNVTKLIFERRRNVLGSKLRTKLTLAFVFFALVPTTFLFFVALQFINTSMDYWFNVRVEQSLQNSLEVGRTYYKQVEHNVLFHAEGVGADVTRFNWLSQTSYPDLSRYLETKQREYGIDNVEVLSPSYEKMASLWRRKAGMPEGVRIPSSVLRRCIAGETGIVDTYSSPNGDLIRGFAPVFGSDGKEVSAVVAVGVFIPVGLTSKMQNIASGIEDYKELKYLKRPIKISLIIILMIITLVIVFSATWFGFYLARGITVPIQQVAEGTRRIAEGDLDFKVDIESEDEIGTLVESFNTMTADLKASRSELERAGTELERSHLETEQRRRYMETILRNVAAGVISLDNDGRIGTMNKFAEELLGVKVEDIAGKTYQELATPEQLAAFSALMDDARKAKKGSAQKTVRLTINGQSLSLLINATLLKDDNGNDMGTVVVFDDLTQLERAQRMAAWREVARRIAHEVKNPLTPIQLSAQRLRKRYMDKLADDSQVLDDCTRTIISQVEELKNLVNEFSLFARLPATNPTLNSLEEVIGEVVRLYSDSHKYVDFTVGVHQLVPRFYFDREQIKRVMINLFDNAIASMKGKGKIEVNIFHDTLNPPIVRVEVSDDGIGIAPEDKKRIFEPYFSAKKGGTGLGLAITNTIISDHNGYIRAQDNEPRGAKFIFELPLQA